MKKYIQTFEEIEEKIRQNLDIFRIPNDHSSFTEPNGFPEFLKNKLLKFEEFFQNELNGIINEKIPFENVEQDVILNKIRDLNKVILDVIEKYYEGKPFEANDLFIKGLEKTFLRDIQYQTSIEKGKSFYRARNGNDRHFRRKDLFHIDFKFRHLVSTKRYSIPGFPALYLGDSTYVCWEEFNKPSFKNLWFSRFENNEKLEIIEILLVDDFLKSIETIHPDFKFTFIFRYLIYFPITLASTIKVKYTDASFKPEYIIPQMLLEYVVETKEIDGIKFPSTKIDYTNVKKLECYNYVFPVKSNRKEGVCPELKHKFSLTEPTSIEIEELIFNPVSPPTFLYNGPYKPEVKINLFNEKELLYFNTSFGKMEELLRNKESNVL